MSTVRIPADVDREDTLLAGLTARQLAILAVAGLVAWLLYQALHQLVPPPVLAAVTTPIGCGAVALALGRRDGMTADRLAVAVWHYLRASRVAVPGGGDALPRVPSALGLQPPMYPEHLRVPPRHISDDGIIDLGEGGAAIVCHATAVTLDLRTDPEQEALVAAFARFLNSLSSSVQIVARCDVVDLTWEASALEEAAPTLAHPALEQAARSHAAFLRELSARRDALRRELFVVVHDAVGGADAAIRLRRQADEAETSLAAAGIRLTRLDGLAVARALRPTRTGSESPAGARQ